MPLFEHSPALLCVAVFLARVVDVSLGTLRTIFVIRGFRCRAAITGFIEILIWLAAASAVLRDLSAWYVAVAYAGGFATGNYVGIWVESKLAIGMELVRAISTSPDVQLARRLREAQFSVTELAGLDDGGAPVEVLFVVEERRRLPKLLQLLDRVDPDAIYTVSDVKQHGSAASARSRSQRMFHKRK